MTTRFRSFVWLFLATPGFFVGGCSCDPQLVNPCNPDEIVCFANGMTTCLPSMGDPSEVCRYSDLGYNNGYCDPNDIQLHMETCSYECGATPGMLCQPPPKMQPGYMAQYLDSVTVASGTGQEYVGISGYAPGWLDETNTIWPYTDLVYAQYTPTPGGDVTVDFTIIDGKPADGENNIYFDPTGFRDGNIDPGDDVGKYSTITELNGALYIAYSDFTAIGSYKLKLAYRPAGATTFTISIIDSAAPVMNGGAFYPSITISNAGVPVVAYGVRQPATAPGAQPTGWVRVATAASATPNGVGDWTMVDLMDSSANVGCVDGDGLCATGDRCIAVGTTGRGECATPATSCTQPDPANPGSTIPLVCTGMFGAVEICVNNTCQSIKKGTDLIDTTGMFNNLVPTATGLALAYHDRGAGKYTGVMCDLTSQCSAEPYAVCSGAVNPAVVNDGKCVVPNGNLWGVRFDDGAGTWGNRFLIDGYSRNDPLAGDCGLHASLVVDSASGDWLLAYLDGTFDRVRYVRYPAGAVVPPPAATYHIVDDGTADYVGTSRPADRQDGRRRLVGGEISLAVSPAGELRILYQDLTGPASTDPLKPIGPQPLLALSSTAGVSWNVSYAATGTQNSGFWTTQSLGVLAGSTDNVSYCVWVERAANTNSGDITQVPVPDGAWTHVRTCATNP